MWTVGWEGRNYNSGIPPLASPPFAELRNGTELPQGTVLVMESPMDHDELRGFDVSVCFVALIVDCSRSWLGWHVVGPVLRSHDAVDVCFGRDLITVTVHVVVVNGESQALGVQLFGNSCSRGWCVMLVVVQCAQLAGGLLSEATVKNAGSRYA